MVKIVSFNGQYRITLPKDLVESKGWDKGTKIAFFLDNSGNICLKCIDDKEKEKKGEVVLGDEEG